MTNNDLYTRAMSAAYAYQKIFGHFPNKIGIDYDRLCHNVWPHMWINFPELVETSIKDYLTDDIMNWTPPNIHMTICHFEPVVNVDPNEAYFQHPHNPNRIITAEELLLRAERITRF